MQFKQKEADVKLIFHFASALFHIFLIITSHFSHSLAIYYIYQKPIRLFYIDAFSLLPSLLKGASYEASFFIQWIPNLSFEYLNLLGTYYQKGGCCYEK